VRERHTRVCVREEGGRVDLISSLGRKAEGGSEPARGDPAQALPVRGPPHCLELRVGEPEPQARQARPGRVEPQLCPATTASATAARATAPAAGMLARRCLHVNHTACQ
jgi:hypothetical protein